MCVHILSGQAQHSDKDLFQEFIEMLNTITDCREGKSYNRRLYQLSVVVMDLAIAAEFHHKRRRVSSDLSDRQLAPCPDLVILYYTQRDRTQFHLSTVTTATQPREWLTSRTELRLRWVS